MERFGQDKELIMEFPCNFPIKVVGLSGEVFHEQIIGIVCQHDTEFTRERISLRHSKSAKYQSLTLQVRAVSKEQIDAIYQDLKACEQVLWAL